LPEEAVLVPESAVRILGSNEEKERDEARSGDEAGDVAAWRVRSRVS